MITLGNITGIKFYPLIVLFGILGLLPYFLYLDLHFSSIHYFFLNHREIAIPIYILVSLMLGIFILFGTEKIESIFDNLLRKEIKNDDWYEENYFSVEKDPHLKYWYKYLEIELDEKAIVHDMIKHNVFKMKFFSMLLIFIWILVCGITFLNVEKTYLACPILSLCYFFLILFTYLLSKQIKECCSTLSALRYFAVNKVKTK